MDQVGSEFLDPAAQPARRQQHHREVAAVEALDRRDPDHARLVHGRVLELRAHHQRLVAVLAVSAGKRFHRACHPTHMRGVGVGDHEDTHAGLLTSARPAAPSSRFGAYPGRGAMMALDLRSEGDASTVDPPDWAAPRRGGPRARSSIPSGLCGRSASASQPLVAASPFASGWQTIASSWRRTSTRVVSTRPGAAALLTARRSSASSVCLARSARDGKRRRERIEKAMRPRCAPQHVAPRQPLPPHPILPGGPWRRPWWRGPGGHAPACPTNGNDLTHIGPGLAWPVARGPSRHEPRQNRRQILE